MSAAVYHRKLARVLDRMGSVYALNDIFDRLADGRMQSFSHGNSMLITEINAYPRGRTLDVLAAVGEIADCCVLHDEAITFADTHNISLIRAYGRRGWMPFARDRGWRVLTTNHVYVKEL